MDEEGVPPSLKEYLEEDRFPTEEFDPERFLAELPEVMAGIKAQVEAACQTEDDGSIFAALEEAMTRINEIVGLAMKWASSNAGTETKNETDGLESDIYAIPAVKKIITTTSEERGAKRKALARHKLDATRMGVYLDEEQRATLLALRRKQNELLAAYRREQTALSKRVIKVTNEEELAGIPEAIIKGFESKGNPETWEVPISARA